MMQLKVSSKCWNYWNSLVEEIGRDNTMPHVTNNAVYIVVLRQVSEEN